MKNIAVLILAAGSASRMGSIKQLLPYKKSTLLNIVINNALASKADRVYCVLGATSESIKKEIQVNNVVFIYNPNWQKGLSSSIVTGIKYLQNLNKPIEAVLILLADQANVNPNYINKLIELYEQNTQKIVASFYDDIKGVPAIFPSNSFNNLLKLKGDKGAKTFLNSSNKNVITPVLKYSHILNDIDTPEDYIKFLKNN